MVLIILNFIQSEIRYLRLITFISDDLLKELNKNNAEVQLTYLTK